MESQKERYQEAIRRAELYIEANLSSKLVLEDVASSAFVSPYHFHRIFKTIKHETVRDYILRIRLESAAHFLKHTDEDVSVVALKFGFENPESFSRSFKAYYDCSPSAFRISRLSMISEKKKLKTDNFNRLRSLIAKPEIREIGDLNLVYKRHIGSYDKVAASFQSLMFWAARHLVLKMKPSTLGIIHDNPELTEESKIRFDACVVVRKEVSANGDIGYKRISGGRFAVFRFKGPYEEFYDVYDYLYHECIYEFDWGLDEKPALEWYVKGPPFNKPEEYVTEFFIPIK